MPFWTCSLCWSTGHPGRVVHEAIRCMNLKSRGEVSGGGREHTHFCVIVEVTRMEAIM